MDPIALLMEEHRVIEKVLQALEAYAAEVAAGAAVDRADLGRFASFLRGFADACHHGKEEGILFEAMVRNGFPRDQGPLAVMLEDHEEGRRLTGIMAAAAEAPEWSDEDRRRIVAAARGYTALLRAHIEKEDNVLYRMGVVHLPVAVMEQVGEEMVRFAAEETGEGDHGKLLALAEDLARKYAKAVGTRVCDH